MGPVGEKRPPRPGFGHPDFADTIWVVWGNFGILVDFYHPSTVGDLDTPQSTPLILVCRVVLGLKIGPNRRFEGLWSRTT